MEDKPRNLSDSERLDWLRLAVSPSSNRAPSADDATAAVKDFAEDLPENAQKLAEEAKEAVSDLVEDAPVEEAPLDPKA